MEIKSLEELQHPDGRGLHFTPFGLGGQMRPGDAAEFQQKLISSLDLPEKAPQTTRDAFERLRTLHSYGVLCYDLYTVAGDLARLVTEQALRERFLPFYNDVVTFTDAQGTDHTIQTGKYDDLYDQLHSGERLRRPKLWRLKLRNGNTIYFDGMLASLLRWARAEGMLGGQRDRVRDRSRIWFRNFVAHPRYHLQDPNHSAQAITDLAAFISRLWDADPGLSVHREPMVIAWTEKTTVSGLARYFQPSRVPDTAPHVLFLADPDDPDLLDYNAHYQTTARPSQYLWGPGTWQEAAAWLEDHQPAADRAPVLDRLFLLRYHNQRLYLPRKPTVAASLDICQQAGTWYLLRADSPIDAFNHQRQTLVNIPGHQPAGLCNCPVETITTGTWREILDHCTELGADTTPRPAPDTQPTISRMPRWNEIIGNGQWTVHS